MIALDPALIVLCGGTILCSIGFVGWIYQLLGWEQKKMELWDEDRPAKKTLLHRYGGWLFFPMAIFGSETTSYSGNPNLGWFIIVATIVISLATPTVVGWLLKKSN